jgi:OOP family OmpA-OmpF porin
MNPWWRTTMAILVGLALLGGTVAVHARASERVLRDQELHEETLIQALMPPLEGAEPRKPVTDRKWRGGDSVECGRTIKPVPCPDPRPPRASVLVTFRTDSAELDDDGRRRLDVVARALSSSQLGAMRFVVEGHADPRGTPEGNLRLSQARAESVRHYLVSTHRIQPGRLVATGKGDREPLNRREIAAPENRRVTFETRLP